MKNNYKLIFTILLASIPNVKLIASCTTPSSSAGNPVITCASGPNMTITWTAAGTSDNCNGYVVIRYTSYPANNQFTIADGTALPAQGTSPYLYAGNYNGYIEYVGSGLSTTTTDAVAGTQYYWYIIPYNNGISACSPAPVYNVTSVTSVTNAPSARPGQVSSVSTGTPTAYTIPNITFPPVSGADGYLVCTNPNGYYSSPTDGVTYNVGDTFDNGSGSPWDQTVQYNGPNTSDITASTNLLPNTNYAITVYAFVNNKYPCSGGPLYVSPVSRTTGTAKTQLNTGIAEKSDNGLANGSVTIYPNPTEKYLTVSGSQITSKATLNIYNTLGMKIYSMQPEITNSQSGISIDISSFSKGIYFLEVKTGSELITKNFIKQ